MLEPPLALGTLASLCLRADFDGGLLTLSVSRDGIEWLVVARDLDATRMSDETPSKGIGFTGTFVAMCAHDMSGQHAAATFSYFDVREG